MFNQKCSKYSYKTEKTVKMASWKDSTGFKISLVSCEFPLNTDCITTTYLTFEFPLRCCCHLPFLFFTFPPSSLPQCTQAVEYRYKYRYISTATTIKPKSKEEKWFSFPQIREDIRYEYIFIYSIKYMKQKIRFTMIKLRHAEVKI